MKNNAVGLIDRNEQALMLEVNRPTPEDTDPPEEKNCCDGSIGSPTPEDGDPPNENDE